MCFCHWCKTTYIYARGCTCTVFVLLLLSFILSLIFYWMGLDGSVGIATRYRLDLSEDRVPVEARFHAPVQTGPGAHPASCTVGTGSFRGVKYGRGVVLTTHLLLVPQSWKSRTVPLTTVWATTGPVTGHFTFTFTFTFVYLSM